MRIPHLVLNNLDPSRAASRNSDLLLKKRKTVAVATTSAAIVVVRTTLLTGALTSTSALASRLVKTYTVSAVPSLLRRINNDQPLEEGEIPATVSCLYHEQFRPYTLHYHPDCPDPESCCLSSSVPSFTLPPSLHMTLYSEQIG